jgi:hypothetical protein
MMISSSNHSGDRKRVHIQIDPNVIMSPILIAITTKSYLFYHQPSSSTMSSKLAEIQAQIATCKEERARLEREEMEREEVMLWAAKEEAERKKVEEAAALEAERKKKQEEADKKMAAE